MALSFSAGCVQPPALDGATIKRFARSVAHLDPQAAAGMAAAETANLSSGSCSFSTIPDGEVGAFLVPVPDRTMGAVTGLASTDVFTRNGHGLKVGDAVAFTSLTGGSGITSGQTYWVISVPTADTFTVSASPGGSILNFTTDLTAGTLVKVALRWVLRSAATTNQGNATATTSGATPDTRRTARKAAASIVQT